MTPFEVGLCGVMCVDKKETIMAEEQKQREQEPVSTVITAVIVSKGGAPIISNGMDR